MDALERRAKHTEYMRGWRPLNRERINAGQRVATATDPEKIRARKVNFHWQLRGGGGEINGDDLRFVRERDDGRCVFCGTPTTEVDHDIPVARDGLNVRANLQLCCRLCNQRKRQLTGAEFRGEVPAFCPAGHVRTPENRVVRGTGGEKCLECERTRWPASPATIARSTQRRRERLAADPALRELDRGYKRAYKARQRLLRIGR